MAAFRLATWLGHLQKAYKCGRNFEQVLASVKK